MAKVPITVMGYRCDRCEHEWIPRGDPEEPKVCPKCKSPYWNRPRKNAPPMNYETFRDKIKDALAQAGKPLTWTEIRMAARLPQAFPNNKWVRRMEGDDQILLVREKDEHGILHWRLAEQSGGNHGPRPGAKAARRSDRRPTPEQGRLE